MASASSSSRIPHLLEPYLALPSEASLTLLTSVLGASANWLVLRHLYSYLRGGGEQAERQNDVGVVLVSFLRDGAFWRDGAAKMGLDLDAFGRTGRFVNVDGLTGLLTGSASPAAAPGARKGRVLRSTGLPDIQREIEAALADVKSPRKVLIIDGLDALLAITDESTTALALQNQVLSLRSLAHSTVLVLAADSPLVASQATTLEREHASLVLSTAHAADLVLALRLLDTGTARDVSGVVRITGPLAEGEGGPKEYLYHMAADGGVRVFERGT